METSTPSKVRVAVVDYGLGNLRSVAGAIEKLGHEAVISGKKQDLEDADKLILPGVGAFGDGMANLDKLGLVKILDDLVLNKKKPILGICLGAQLMARESSEFGHHKGLGWIDASVRRFEFTDKTLRVPHVGWNNLQQVKPTSLFDEIPSDALFYYVHSYWISSNIDSVVMGSCNYGSNFTAVFSQDNIWGTQFHPEKSQKHGLTLLNNFLKHKPAEG